MTQESRNYRNKESKLVRSFGRIKSRKLSDRKNYLLENLAPKYQIEHENDIKPSIKGKNILEIGFGFGDFLFEKAKNNPNDVFFGSEPHINGVVNVLSKLDENPLNNLKISTTDVRILLEKFPNKFFDEVYILFPDPWPKLKHFKRRLINIEFLDDILAIKVKNNAKLTIATDHDLYKTWILAEVLRCKSFNWPIKSSDDWKIFPKDWIETKYQKKAIIEGRVPVIFKLDRVID